MKHGMWRARFTRRAIALIAALCLLAGIVPTVALGEGGPNIPYGDDLSGYKPDKDGYYGVISTYAKRSGGWLKAQLPVLVYSGCAYIDPLCFPMLFPEITVDVMGQSVAVQSATRRLEMNTESASARFIIVSRYNSTMLSDIPVRLSAAPCLSDRRVWVPMTDVFGLLGMEYIAGSTEDGGADLVLYAPARQVIDVLADLHAPSGRKVFWYEFPQTDRFTQICLELGMALALATDRAASMKLTEIIRTARGTNIRPFLDTVANTTEHELAMTLSESIDEISDGIMTMSEMRDIYTCSQGLRDSAFSVAFAGLSALAIGGSCADAYARRDELAIRSLEYFCSHSPAASMDRRLKEAVDTAVKNMRDEQTYVITNTVDGSWQNFTDIIGQAVLSEVEKKGLSGLAENLVGGLSIYNEISIGYRAADFIQKNTSSYWKDTMDEIEQLEKAAYGLFLQQDSEKLLADTLDGLKETAITADELDEGIMAAYLYLKTCAALSETADSALGLDDVDGYQISETAQEAYGDLSILASAYNTDNLAPLTPDGIVRQAMATDHGSFIPVTTPLYTRPDALVLVRETYEPVHDARVEFMYDGSACGHVSGTPDGKVRNVAVPLFVPEGIHARPVDADLAARFNSPSYSDADTVSAPVVTGGRTMLPTAYLGDVKPGVVLLNRLVETYDGDSEAHITFPTLVGGTCEGANGIACELDVIAGQIREYYANMSGSALQPIAAEDDYEPNYGDFEGDYEPNYGDFEGDYEPNYGDFEGDYEPNYGDFEGDYEPNYGDYDGDYYNTDGPANGYGFQYAYVINDTYATERVLSLRVTETSLFVGAARPLHVTSNLSYDLLTGNRLTVPDLLDPDVEDAAERLAWLIADRYRQCENELWISPLEVGREVAEGKIGQWLFTPEGWLLFFDYEEIALRMSGTLDEIFPYRDLEGIFQEGFLHKVDTVRPGAIAAIPEYDERFANDAYTVYGEPQPNGLIFALDGVGAQVHVVSPTVGMNNYETELFYADILNNAIVCLPPRLIRRIQSALDQRRPGAVGHAVRRPRIYGLGGSPMTLSDVKCFLLDMDGTFYLGGQLIEGSLDFIDRVLETGRDFMFLTNNSSHNAEFYVKKLAGMGLSIDRSRVMTSGEATCEKLMELYPGKRAFVLGNEFLVEEFHEAGIPVDNEDPEIVVIGFDTSLDYKKMQDVCDFVRAGLPYIATHPDFNCPTETGFMPDIGAIMAFIEASTGRRPDLIVGKPHTGIVEAVLRRTGLKASELAMVGDRLYTDIETGLRSGMLSILVMSGETTEEMLAESPTKPDLKFGRLSDMVPLL